MDLFSKCQKFTTAREVMAAGYYPYFRRIETAQGPEVIIDGEKKIVCCSNNYLGLSLHPKVKRAAIEAIKKYGTSCTGSRFLSGSLDLHEKVERKFARFIGKESALLFTTGHHSNLGAISTLVGKNELVITDKLDHASIIDGCMLSFGEMLRYRHNNMEDLERVLSKNRDVPKLIVVDGVFSMEGDIARLVRLRDLADAYGALLIIDESHATGVLGERGRGTAEHFGVLGEGTVQTSTLGKTLGGACGGYVAGTRVICDYLLQKSRPHLFSNALPPSVCCGAIAAIDILMEEPDRLAQLRSNTGYFREKMGALGFHIPPSITPIVPVIVGETALAINMQKALLHDRGAFVSGFGYPVVPEGAARLRCQISSAHSREDLDAAVSAFRSIGEKFGVIA